MWLAWGVKDEKALHQARDEVAKAEARLQCIAEEEARGLPSLEAETQARAAALRKPRVPLDSGERAWDAAGIRRHLSELFHLHFKTPLHARLRLVNRGKAVQGYTPELLRQNFLQLFGIDLTGEQVKDALIEYWSEESGLVDVGHMLEDLMGQGCPSLSTSSGSSSGTDPVSQKRRVVRQQDGGGSRQQLSSCDAAQGPEVVESFEEALRTKLSQGNKAMTQVYHVLTLLGGRPTCRELRARLHAHLGLSLPDPLLPILLDQYAALPSAADGDEDALLPRINTLRYLQHRILGHNTEDALPPLSPPKPAAAEAENAAGPPAQLDRSLVVLVTEEQLEEALRWSIVRRVPGRAGLLRDACWLFGMGASGKIGLPAFATAVRDTFLLAAPAEVVEALWRRLGGRPVGNDEPAPIFTLLRRLLEEQGAGQLPDTTQDLAWERLVVTSEVLQTARKAQLTRLPLTGHRQVAVSEVVELMAQDVESRHRGFLSQLQYVARLYDPANTGFVNLSGLSGGLVRLGLQLSAPDTSQVFQALLAPTSSSSSPGSQRISLRDLLARLTAEPTAPASSPSLLLRPSRASPSFSSSQAAAPRPPTAASPPSPPPAPPVPTAASKTPAMPMVVSGAGDVAGPEEAEEEEETRAACAVSPRPGSSEPLKPSPPASTKQQGAAGRAGEGAGLAGVRRVPSGRGRMFAFRMQRLRQKGGQKQQPAQPQVSRTRWQLGLER